jgi:hypothetical protein
VHRGDSPVAPEGTADKNYMAKRLSYDHRAEDESEQKRIKDAGGSNFTNTRFFINLCA